MPDEPAVVMPVSAPLISNQDGNRQPPAKRRRDPGKPAFAAETADADPDEEYPPGAVERPDPNQPLYEALDRLRAVEHPPEPDTGRRARAVKAYQEQTTRSVNR